MERWKNNLAVTVLLAIFSMQAFCSLTTKSSTWDETHYFGIGSYLLKHRKWDVRGAILHPPLSFYITSLPLLPLPLDESLWEKVPEDDRDMLGDTDIVRGQAILSSPLNHDDRLLIASRLTITLLAVMLGYYVYGFSAQLYGRTYGLLSLCLFSFCPNMLAFAGIAGPDMVLTVCSFIFLYYWWNALRNRSLNYSLFAGIALGLALLSKFTALILLPVAILQAITFLPGDKKIVCRNLLPTLSIALFLLFLGYGFQVQPYFQGLLFQLDHARIGQDSFLMGEYSESGWWYYYPVAFLLKTPIPTIILFLVATIAFFRGRKKDITGGLFLLIPISAFFLLFCIKHQSIGLRYILPVYPIIFVFIGTVAALGEKLKYPVAILLVWQIISTLHISPHYLAYFNEAIGGPDNGYKYLADSNLDWGQDLKGLKVFMDSNGIERISLSYFGTDSPQRYGIQYDWLPSNILYNPNPRTSYIAPPQSQLIAISATNLQGVTFENKSLFKKLLTYRPIARIGYSIFVYDLGPTDALNLDTSK